MKLYRETAEIEAVDAQPRKIVLRLEDFDQDLTKFGVLSTPKAEKYLQFTRDNKNPPNRGLRMAKFEAKFEKFLQETNTKVIESPYSVPSLYKNLNKDRKFLRSYLEGNLSSLNLE
jgi:hypothetical protein